MNSLLDYDSPNSLKTYLEQNNFAMQKKFGQNFLINPGARQQLINALDLKPTMKVWEIGPGLGAMTKGLLECDIDLTVFEIDRGFISSLKTFFSNNKNFKIIEGDVLKTWKKEASFAIPDRFFGNLPYNIAATLIADTINQGILFDKIVVTIQKEVAQRMSAKPRTPDYSSFSVLVQWAYEVKPIMDLNPGSFWPQPHIVSQAVCLAKKESWPQVKNSLIFTSLVRGLFSSRRKTIKNNFTAWLKSQLPPEQTSPCVKEEFDALVLELLEKAGIDPMARAETLELKDFMRFADIVSAI